MGKFVIECPECGRYNEASTSLFAKRKIKCFCGYTINIKSDKVKSKECQHCGNMIIYDQSLGEKALCPVCKNPINTLLDKSQKVEISCPTCNCLLTVNKDDTICSCPLCDTQIDINSQLQKEKIRSSGEPVLIKFEGGSDNVVWKYPIEDFNYGSTLIVHEGQEAIFLKNGVALEAFGPGKYVLNTNKIISENFKNTDGLVANKEFHTEVYFVNMTVHMGIKWGTDSKVRLFDPASGLHIELGACGQFNIQVVDSNKFLSKVVGTVKEYAQNELSTDGLDRSNMMGKFKALIMNRVKSNLARTIREQQINVLEIDEYLETISTDLGKRINLTLEEYGLYMPNFFITTIMTPDDDPNYRRLKTQFAERTLKVREEHIRKDEAEAAQARKILEAQTEAQLKILEAQGDGEALRIRAQAEAEEMRLKGYTYQQETSRQLGMEAIKNSGNGNIINDLTRIGIGVDSLKDVTNAMSNIGSTSIFNGNTWNCDCGQQNITGNFCGKCGSRKPTNNLWDCICGQKGNTGNFCNNCGSKKSEQSGWTCSCGFHNEVGNFCSNCGRRK